MTKEARFYKALKEQAMKNSVKAEFEGFGDDISYCIRACKNTDCFRHISHAPIGKPVSAINFRDCEEKK